jgi:hypothetical protein
MNSFAISVLTSFTFLLAIPFLVIAQPLNFMLLKPQVQGTGCDYKNINLVQDPQGHFFSLIFDGMQTRVKNTTSVKTCMVMIPIQPAPGTKVVLDKISYRGFADVPSGEARLVSSFSYGANQLKIQQDKFKTGFSNSFDVIKESRSEGKCGKPNFLVITTTLTATSVGEKETSVGVDTADSGITFDTTIISCSR